MRYNSKRDLWLGLLIWLPITSGFLMSVYSAFITKEAITPFIVFTVILSFIAWIWFGTYYVLKETYIIVRCGPFRERIEFADIKSMKETRNVLSSYALSLDRIQIKYRKFGYSLISPINKEDFIKEIEKKSSIKIVRRE